MAGTRYALVTHQRTSVSGVRLWACKLAMEIFHLTEGDLYDDLNGVLTVGGFYERAQTNGTHLLFI